MLSSDHLTADKKEVEKKWKKYEQVYSDWPLRIP